MARSVVVVILIGALGAGASSASALAPASGKVRLAKTPPKITQATTATFRVLAPRGTRLRCRLDTAKPWGCGRRITLKALKPGRHRLSVRGQRRGRQLKSAVFAWNVVVPTGEPQVTGTVPTPNPSDVVEVPDTRPVPATPPAISGQPVVSRSIASVPGTWNGATSVARRWQRCSPAGTECVSLPGETYPAYVVQTADVGHTIRVVERATNASGSRDAASAPTPVVPAPPENLKAPSISGTLTVGQTLTGNFGEWTPVTATLNATWLRCAYNLGAGGSCMNVGFGPTYVLQPQDATQFMVFMVVATDAVAGETPAASTSYGPVAS